MLAVGRVLLVLLAGIPVCRGADDDSGTVYSSYYDADGDTENTDFYDRNNEEIKHPPKRSTVMETRTRLKRNDLEDIRTLNSGEIIDVKEMLNKIMPGRMHDAAREQWARDYADSYEYPENSNNLAQEDRTAIPSEFNRWLPTVEGQRSPAAGIQDNEVDSSSEGTEQHWIFDIGYPQETTTYSNSFIQMDTNNSTETWSPETKVVVLYAQETSTYNNSEMQAEVYMSVQNWSPNSKKESTYNDAAMREEVRLLGQHWSPSSEVKSPSHIRIVQHWNPSMSTADSENPTVNVYKDGPSATVPIKPLADAATDTVPGGAGVANQLLPADGLGTVPSLLGKSSNPPSITPGGSGKGDSGQGGSGKGGSRKGSSGDASPGVTGDKTKPTTKTKTKKTKTTTTKSTTKRTTTRKTTKKTTTTKSTTTRTTTTRTTTRPIDIDAIMAIISNLTYDYEWNLTEQFNKSIIQTLIMAES